MARITLRELQEALDSKDKEIALLERIIKHKEKEVLDDLHKLGLKMGKDGVVYEIHQGAFMKRDAEKLAAMGLRWNGVSTDNKDRAGNPLPARIEEIQPGTFMRVLKEKANSELRKAREENLPDLARYSAEKRKAEMEHKTAQAKAEAEKYKANKDFQAAQAKANAEIHASDNIARTEDAKVIWEREKHDREEMWAERKLMLEQAENTRIREHQARINAAADEHQTRRTKLGEWTKRTIIGAAVAGGLILGANVGNIKEMRENKLKARIEMHHDTEKRKEVEAVSKPQDITIHNHPGGAAAENNYNVLPSTSIYRDLDR